MTGKGAVWHRGGNDFHRTISTVAIHDGIVYAADLSGFLYALDARTGAHYWKHDLLAAVWGSPFVADGRVYIGDEDGDIAILKAGKTKEVIAEPNIGVSVYSTPVASDGVLYVLGRNRLFALQEGARARRRHRAAARAGSARARQLRDILVEQICNSRPNPPGEIRESRLVTRHTGARSRRGGRAQRRRAAAGPLAWLARATDKAFPSDPRAARMVARAKNVLWKTAHPRPRPLFAGRLGRPHLPDHGDRGRGRARCQGR